MGRSDRHSAPPAPGDAIRACTSWSDAARLRASAYPSALAFRDAMASAQRHGSRGVWLGRVRSESGRAPVFVPWAPVVWNPPKDSVSAELAGPPVDDAV